MRRPITARCFKCLRKIEGSMIAWTGWEGASGGINFRGCCNFGSTIYDPLMDGEEYEIIICDKCATEGMRLIRKYEVKKW